MDTKQMMDKLLEAVPEDKRKEAVRELAKAETLEERIEIANRYAGKDVAAGSSWFAEALDLSDEDLEMVAGGGEIPWYYIDPEGCSCN